MESSRELRRGSMVGAGFDGFGVGRDGRGRIEGGGGCWLSRKFINHPISSTPYSELNIKTRRPSTLNVQIMLKATAGGGGMGLQTCYDPDQLSSAFQSVSSRISSLFSDPGIFVEKYIADSRHVEVQIFGDGQGGAVHFGERECSIQRRHQKVVEECPSPFVHGRLGESKSRNNDAAPVVTLIETVFQN